MGSSTYSGIMFLQGNRGDKVSCVLRVGGKALSAALPTVPEDYQTDMPLSVRFALCLFFVCVRRCCLRFDETKISMTSLSGISFYFVVPFPVTTSKLQ